MPDNNPSTLGIEMESTSLSLASMQRAIENDPAIRSCVKSITHDASVESPMAMFGSLPVFMGNKFSRGLARRYDNYTAGYELVTLPLSFEDTANVVSRVISHQIKMGDIVSERTSIHVHTGFPNSLVFLKNAVKLGIKLEPLFFKIAGLGNPYRGTSNSSAYCRPLGVSTAVRLSDSDKLVGVIEPRKVSSSSSRTQFWGLLGVLATERDKYVPVRYIGVNTYSVNLRGTLEFRFLNQSFVMSHVISAIRMFQTVAELAIRATDPDIDCIPDVSLNEKNSNATYEELLDNICRLSVDLNCSFQLNSSHVKSLLNIIDSTPQPFFSDKLILSHVRNSRINTDMAKLMGLPIVDKSLADEAGICDIHTFDSKERTILGEI